MISQSSPDIAEALALAYHELKLHDADYHHRTSVEVNNKIVDALAAAGALSSAGMETPEELKRECDEARQLVIEANNSLYGSQGYFHSLNGGPFDKYHLSRGIEDLKAANRQAHAAAQPVEVTDEMLERAEAAFYEVQEGPVQFTKGMRAALAAALGCDDPAQGPTEPLQCLRCGTVDAFGPVSKERVRASWQCVARKQGTPGGNAPADCDWPGCGCDPAASKVLEAIDEAGFDITPRPLIQKIEAEARRYAEMYPQSSDGRNTFVIFADWVAALALSSTPSQTETAAHPRPHREGA